MHRDPQLQIRVFDSDHKLTTPGMALLSYESVQQPALCFLSPFYVNTHPPGSVLQNLQLTVEILLYIHDVNKTALVY